MDPEFWVMLGGGITTLGTLAALYLNQRAEFRKAKEERESGKERAIKDITKQNEALKEIHSSVNGNLGKALQEIDNLRMLVAKLGDKAGKTAEQTQEILDVAKPNGHEKEKNGK